MIYYTWCSSTEVEENENDGDGTSPCEDPTGGQPCSHPSRKERRSYKTVDLVVYGTRRGFLIADHRRRALRL